MSRETKLIGRLVDDIVFRAIRAGIVHEGFHQPGYDEKNCTACAMWVADHLPVGTYLEFDAGWTGFRVSAPGRSREEWFRHDVNISLAHAGRINVERIRLIGHDQESA